MKINFVSWILSSILIGAPPVAFAFNKKSPSTIAPNFPIPHSHVVSELNSEALVFRGPEPSSQSHYRGLARLNVAKILIFKSEVKDEVQNEIQNLKKFGFTNEQITHIPMRWSLFESNIKACEHVKQALLEIQRSYEARQKIYFHCSVGEDRTSLLDALWTLWLKGESNADAINNFKLRMCSYGYSVGFENRGKPKDITEQIDQDMTPLYLTLAQEILNLKKQSQAFIDIRCGELSYETQTITCQQFSKGD